MNELKMSVNSCTRDASLCLPPRIEVMGVPLDPWTMAQTVNAADRYIKEGRFAHLIGVNADKLLQMRDDPYMDRIVRRCEVVNADGASMVLAARWLGKRVPERVAGIDLMGELCALASQKGYSVYLLGARREVVEKTADMLEGRYPGLRIVGIHDGYFADRDLDAIISCIKEVNPSIVFVGITSPKKERLIELFRERGLGGVFVGVGGSFDVLSGEIPRAPLWMQKTNLEWLFRMVQEPKRLVKRYAFGNARFFLILGKELITRSHV